MADPSAPSSLDPDRNLLFGVLALQVDAITREQFVDACTSWATQKHRRLAEILTERGWLSDADCAEVETLVERKLRKHQGDPRAGLAEVANEGVRQTLVALADPDIHDSIAGLPLGDERKRAATVSYEVQGRERYQLTRLHAAGGIGQVWLARDGDLGRDVALKELRTEGAKRPAFVDRFVKEARITGQLEHPGIIPVYELVRDPSEGSPFYTMRFIRGRTLTEAVLAYHVRQRQGKAESLELRDLLGAFQSVCNAIAYAHSRGVIHRDLKGSNVVLGDFGEVMVLDWGLAKVLGTGVHLTAVPAVDTPADDAEMEIEEESSASSGDLRLQPITLDKSSHPLTVQGQVLGTPAYMAPEQAEGRLDLIDERTDVYGLGAILYELLTGRPPYGADDTATTLRRVIHEPPIAPREVVPAMPAALEAVCLKALAKRPADRYPAATALGREIQHFLADEPVSAYPESLPARAGRWARRHRAAVATAAGVLVCTVAALTVGMVLLSRANTRTNEQRNLAEQNLVQAEKARETSAAISKFLVSDLLGAANPDQNPRDKNVTVAEVLDRAAGKIGGSLTQHPEVEASVLQTLGETNYRLGRLSPAESQLRRAVALSQKVNGPQHGETLYDQAILSEVLWAEGKSSESLTLGRATAETARRALGPADKITLMALNNVGLALFKQGRLSEVEQLFRDLLAGRRQAFGDEDLTTLNAMNNLGRLLAEEGRLRDAEPLVRQAAETALRTQGPEHTFTITARGNLGFVLTELGRTDESEPLLQAVADMSRRVQGADHPRTLGTLTMLNRAILRQGKLEEAERRSRDNLAACRKALGPKRDRTREAADTLAWTLIAEGKYEEARPIVAETLAARREALPTGHYEIAVSLEALGVILSNTAKASEALPLLREAVSIRREALPNGSPQTAQAESALGGVLVQLGSYDEAEPLLLSAHETLAAAPGTPPGVLAETRKRLAELYMAWGKPDQAARWRTNPLEKR